MPGFFWSEKVRERDEIERVMRSREDTCRARARWRMVMM